MTMRLGSAATVAITAATAICGVLLVGGVGPSSRALDGEPIPGVTPPTSAPDSDTIDGTPPTSAPDSDTIDGTPPTSAPDTAEVPAQTAASTTTAPTTTMPATTTTTTAPTTTMPATTTTTTAPTTTMPAVAPSPVPLSLTSPAQGPDGVVVVGAGSVVTLEGQCTMVDGVPLGPVEIWAVDGTTGGAVVDRTGVTANSWTYDWVAPDTGGVSTLLAWCGNPLGYEGGYPVDLRIPVSVVEVGPPPTTPTTPTTTTSPSGSSGVIPSTD